MSKRINPFSVIRCGNADDAYHAYVAMFRYAFGRRDFLFTPEVVVKIIKHNKNFLTNRVLERFDWDLAEAAERYEREYRDWPNRIEYGSNYGTECDRETWLAFHAWVKEQISKRKEGAK